MLVQGEHEQKKQIGFSSTFTFSQYPHVHNKYRRHQENLCLGAAPKAAGKGVILFGIPSHLYGDLSIT